MLHSYSSKVIIFDWDDTICPSSFVDQCKINSFQDLPLHVSQTKFHIFHTTGTTNTDTIFFVCNSIKT